MNDTPLPEPAPPSDAERAELQAHMQEHLKAVTAVREALVRADLKAAREANRAFLHHKVAFHLPGEWPPRVAAMGTAAVALDGSANVAEAAGHAAEVVAACGACHQAVGAEVSQPVPAPLEGHADTASAELRAMWAQLIEGGGDAGAAAAALTACAACHEAGDPLPPG